MKAHYETAEPGLLMRFKSSGRMIKRMYAASIQFDFLSVPLLLI